MSSPLDYFKDPSTYVRELSKVYKKIFSGTIKESFLLDMSNRIETNPRFGVIFFANDNLLRMVSADSSAIGRTNYSLIVCKLIVMCHYANTVSVSEFERGKLQESNAYKDKLTNDVLNMLKLKDLIMPNSSSSSLESFLPIIYYTAALNSFLSNKFDELNSKRAPVQKPYNNDFNYLMLYKLLVRIKACISLVDVNAIDELMVVFRSLIELFMTYIVLWDQNGLIIDSFYKFDQIAFDYNYGKDIPADIKMQAKDLGVKPIDYINYGWIKNLEKFKILKSKSKTFSIKSLSEIVDYKYKEFSPEYGAYLYKCYKECNPQIHGTTLIMNYLQLELSVFHSLDMMLELISIIMSKQLFTFDLVYKDVNLIDELNKVFNESKKVADYLFQNEKALNKTNQDYIKRITCSNRMKL